MSKMRKNEPKHFKDLQKYYSNLEHKFVQQLLWGGNTCNLCGSKTPIHNNECCVECTTKAINHSVFRKNLKFVE